MSPDLGLDWKPLSDCLSLPGGQNPETAQAWLHTARWASWASHLARFPRRWAVRAIGLDPPLRRPGCFEAFRWSLCSLRDQLPHDRSPSPPCSALANHARGRFLIIARGLRLVLASGYKGLAPAQMCFFSLLYVRQTDTPVRPSVSCNCFVAASVLCWRYRLIEFFDC